MDDRGQDIRFLFDKKEGKLGGIRYEGILPEFKPTTQNFVKVESDLRQKFSAYMNDIIDYDNAFERFVIYQWSDIYAGNIGIYDTSSGQYYVMFHLNQELNKPTLPNSKHFHKNQ